MYAYDIIIIGGGPAGLAAGLYASRRNLKTLVLFQILGGQMSYAPSVENYPGSSPIPGVKLAEKMKKQAKKFGCKFKMETVVGLDLKSEIKKVKTTEKEYKAKAVIIATGSHYRKLEAEGEDRFIGKGVSYCATCVLPGTKVVKNPTIEPIENITSGRVFTHKGKYEPVLGKSETKYDGVIVKIKPTFFRDEISLTPNHEILVIRAKRCKQYGGCLCKKFCSKQNEIICPKYYKKYKPTWIAAKDLTKDDFLVYPVLRKVKDVKRIKIRDVVDFKIDKSNRVYNSFETHSSHRLKNEIVIDSDFMRLVGYYISEGFTNGHGISFSFNKSEKGYIKDIKNILKKKFDIPIFIRHQDNVTTVSCYSIILEELFKSLFGKYAHNKHLPYWMLYLPQEKQKELFKAMWRGDGSKTVKGFHYTTSSKFLAEQLRQLLLRIELLPSIYITRAEHRNKRPSKIDGREIYFKHDKHEFEIKGGSVVKGCEILDISHAYVRQRNRIMHYGWVDEKYAYLKPRKISFDYYKGPVLNLTVRNDNSFVTTSLTLHNCDGPLFKNKKVAIIGGSDTAVKSALYLSEIASEVYLIHRRDQLRAEEANQENLKKSAVKIIWNSVVDKIEGDNFVNKIIIKDVNTNETKELEIDGVFVEIGEIPTTEIMKAAGVEINEKNFINVNDNFETNIQGVFAAGDVTGSFAQIVVAAAEGAEAATNAYLFLKGGVYGEKKPADYGEKK